MAKITLIEACGEVHEIDAKAGTSLLDAALDSGITSMEGMCGGACACGTCHCYIEEPFVELVGPADEEEGMVISGLDEPEENSRLACQVIIDDSLDGLVVTLPMY